jgi:hypothetical protein
MRGYISARLPPFWMLGSAWLETHPRRYENGSKIFTDKISLKNKGIIIDNPHEGTA